MKLIERVEAFVNLGKRLRSLTHDGFSLLAKQALLENAWFTKESVSLALQGVIELLEEGKLRSWVLAYGPEPSVSKTIGIAMAGNIPLVGFHDFLAVLISGHRLKHKLSSKDSVLMKFIQEELLEIEPRFSEKIFMSDTLTGSDAMLGTGSDNTGRYFEYYFRNIPHIIRKNRASCAVIQGDETRQELQLLGVDVFSYFGLGCRNVSLIFIPNEFDPGVLLDSWKSFKSLMMHSKYANNYLYQKTLSLMNQEIFLDNGFVLLKQRDSLVSPISTLFFNRYNDQQELHKMIATYEEKLQVVVSAQSWFERSVSFGKAQLPEVSEYADHVDTMKFLMALK